MNEFGQRICSNSPAVDDTLVDSLFSYLKEAEKRSPLKFRHTEGAIFLRWLFIDNCFETNYRWRNQDRLHTARFRTIHLSPLTTDRVNNGLSSKRFCTQLNELLRFHEERNHPCGLRILASSSGRNRLKAAGCLVSPQSFVPRNVGLIQLIPTFCHYQTPSSTLAE